jgi:two-component system, OmpR family, response regulator QseB
MRRRRMPGMDGLEPIRRLRQLPARVDQTPAIVVTADTPPDLDQRCRTVGANEVILKPVALNALIDAIAVALAIGTGDDLLLD